MKKYKKKIFFYKILKILSLLLLIITLFLLFLRVFVNFTISNVITNEKYEIKEPLSFLLLGSDYRKEKSSIDGARSDTMIVVTLNPSNSRGNIEVEAVSIPRDAIAKISCAPDDNTYEKINSAFNYGLGEGDGSNSEDLNNAISCTQKSIENLLNVNIDYYVMASFDAVINIVDAIGGITINSKQDICVEDANGHGFSTDGSCLENSLLIKKGSQTLDGEHALGYARSRYGVGNSDYERNMRQQEVIFAIAKKIIKDPIKYANDFIKVFQEDCETNIGINDIWTYINFATSLYNNITLNLSDSTPVYIDNKSSIYENVTESQIVNNSNSNIQPIDLSELYGSENTEDFEKYTSVSRHILTKEMVKGPSNIDKELNIVDENKNTLNPITIEFSSFSIYATEFSSNGYYSYIDQDSLYYTSNLLRKSLNYKVEDITYDYDTLSSLYYIDILRNPLHIELEGIEQQDNNNSSYNNVPLDNINPAPIDSNSSNNDSSINYSDYLDGSNSTII